MSLYSWRQWTQARVGLGRHGSSMPTASYLELLEAQALARDSLWRTWDTRPLEKFLIAEQQPVLKVETAIKNRQDYLTRPDLGRKISLESTAYLLNCVRNFDQELVFCVSDGLATDAIDQHLRPFLQAFLPELRKEPFYQQKPYPFVLVPFARVAAADPIAVALKSRLSVIFVGERPGLSSHDSLGIYLTFAPALGTPDSRRNWISNIRVPHGLAYEIAAQQLLYLMRESLRLKLSGVGLKLDWSDSPSLAAGEYFPAE